MVVVALKPSKPSNRKWKILEPRELKLKGWAATAIPFWA